MNRMDGRINVSTHIFYGIFVTTISLFTAAETYFRAQPIISLISIISARKNKGIESSSTEVINKVPNEVWEMIKLESIPLARTEFCKEMLIRIRCAKCAESCARMDGCGLINQSNHSGHQINSWRKCIDSHECDKCHDPRDDAESDYVGNNGNNGIYGRSRMESFLNKLNFNLVSKVSFSDTESSYNDCLTPITVDSNFNKIVHGNSRSDYDHLPVHILAPLQPKFNLSASPESIASRFAKLVHEWDLDLEDPNKRSCGTLQGNLAHHNGISLDVEQDEEYYQTPQWYLWTRTADA